MKKNLKKTCAKALAVVLALGMVAATPVDAKKASVKLSKTKVTVTKGKTVKVTVKKGKVKTWSVNKAGKKVVKLAKKSKKYVKIKGLKAGKATVTAKFTNKAKKNIKVTVKAAAAKNNNPSKATDAPKTPDAPKASAAPAKATDTPAPTKPAASATPAPTKPAGPAVEFDGKVDLKEANAAGFSTSGSYCTIKFNADGSFDYDSTPSAEDATGSVYNNGCAFYLDKANKEPVDLAGQGFQYVAIKVKTDAEFKLMTWSDPDLVDTENFWDKNDTWGNVVKTVANEDGSKTLVYAVEDVFTDSELACTIGFTLKSNGVDEDTFLARQGTVYSIEFTKEMPAGEAAATPVPATATGAIAVSSTAAVVGDEFNAATELVLNGNTVTSYAWTVSGSALAVKGDADKATATFEAKEAGKASVICTVVTSGNTLTLEKEINVTSDKVENVVKTFEEPLKVAMAASGKAAYDAGVVADIKAYAPADMSLYKGIKLTGGMQKKDGTFSNKVNFFVKVLNGSAWDKNEVALKYNFSVDTYDPTVSIDSVYELNFKSDLDPVPEALSILVQNGEDCKEDFDLVIKKIEFVAK